MTNDEEIAIKVEHVSKDFVLPHEKVSSVKGMFTNLGGSHKHTKEVQHALKDINFEIKKGEFFGIVGRNGSGKSTLLKILAGIYQPSAGEVYTQGKLVPFIELGVGFNPELTGRENVYLNGAMLGFAEKEIDAMYKDVVSFAELEKFMDQKLKNYSSGMQVRLAFSMATRSKADILLVDEILAVGDADFQRKCFDYFTALKGAGVTVIFVTHDMNAVREYCDRAVLIENNELVMEGTPDKIANSYTKMFIEQASEGNGGALERKRWGDGAISFKGVSISPLKVVPGVTEVTLTCRAVSYQDVSKPIFGFIVKNAAHVHLLGSNNQILEQQIPEIKKGEEITVKWTFPNIFSEGTYYVDPGIVYKGGNQTADWWEEACSFKVYKESNTPHMVSPSLSLTIDHAKQQ